MKAIAVLVVLYLAVACQARELKQNQYATVAEALTAAGGTRVSTLIAAVQVQPINCRSYDWQLQLATAAAFTSACHVNAGVDPFFVFDVQTPLTGCRSDHPC